MTSDFLHLIFPINNLEKNFNAYIVYKTLIDSKKMKELLLMLFLFLRDCRFYNQQTIINMFH